MRLRSQDTARTLRIPGSSRSPSPPREVHASSPIYMTLQSNSFPGRPGPLLLVIMDGVGIGKRDDSDGVFRAKTPVLDQLTRGWDGAAGREATAPPFYTTLQAHGTAVGMPSDKDMGNSEVGHNALGAGRVFKQGAALVQESIDSGAFFTSELWGKLAATGQGARGLLHCPGRETIQA